jgi:autotransporter-associated beta strand protein
MGITTVIRKASFLRCEWVRRTALAVALGGMFAAAPTQPASAQTYTWSGTNALWNTTNWITSSGTTTFPGGSSGTNTAIINSGTVSFAGNDTFGNSGNTSSPVIRIGSGGTLASGGFFNSLWNVNLNGGTLLANGGAASAFPTFQLAGTLLVDGSTASNISVGGGSNNQINIGGNGNLTLTMNVADVTSSTAADLTVGAVLQNLSGNVGSLTKTGAGTLVLSAANTYTGATNINGGVLQIASGGSLSSAGDINSTAGGNLSIVGSVTMAANTYFAVGNGILNTTGTTSIDGGTLAVGNNAFLIGGSRNGLPGAGGLGTFVVNSGTVTVSAGGGTGGGQDTSAIWLAPYASSTSQLVLNGGVLSTGRQIQNGSGSPSTVAFNGGTIQLTADRANIISGVTTVIHSGGAIVDTNGFNGAFLQALSSGTGATAGGLTKLGSGTLTLSAANTYTGTTTVSAGSLRYGAANAISTGPISIQNGATLDLATFSDSVGAVTLTSGNIIGTGTLTSTAGFTVTSGSIAAPLAGSAGLTKQGSGTVVLSGANPYSGATLINGGVLQIASGGALSSAGSINSTAGGLLSISGSVTMAANTYFAVGGGITSTTGTTSIDGGSLAIGNNAFLIGGGRGDAGAYGVGTFILNSGTVTVGAGQATSGGSDATRVWLNPYGNTGTSALVLNGGVFNTARGIQNGSAGQTAVAFNGGTLQLGTNLANVTVSISTVSIHSGGAVIDTNGFNGTFSQALATGTGATAGGLTKLGSGTLTLSAANSYTGTTTISGGVLALSSAGSLASTGAVAIPTSGAAFDISAASASRTIGMLTGVAGSTVALGANALTVGNATTGTFAGVISGSGSLTKQGAGTLTLTGANTYTGATSISGGAVVIGAGGSLSSAGNINTTAGGNLSIAGNVTMAANTYFAVGNGILNTTGTTSIDGGTLAVGNNAFLIGGGRNESRNGGLGTFVINSGTVTVSAGGGTGGGQDTTSIWLNPYASGTSQLVLNGGVLSTARQIQNGSPGSATTVAFNGGTIQLTADRANIISGVNTFIHSGGAIVDTNGFNGAFLQALSSGTGATAGGLTKLGSGTLTLSTVNSYTGPTAINAGLLAINGSVPGAVNVANSATLGGNGTIGGLVTVAGGGILAPGTSPGTLTMTSGLSLADSSILNYELVATDTTVGGGINDLTVVTGNFTLDGILNVAGTGDFTTVADFTTWRLFNYSGGTFTDGGLTLGTLPAVGSAGRYFQIDTATPGQVNLVIVPEPGAIALVAIGLAIAGWHVSRRRPASRS